MMMIQTQVDMGSLSLGNSRLYCAPSRSYNTRDRGGSFIPVGVAVCSHATGAYRTEI